jgi:putative SOS response-associated peptidase YedK
MVGGASVDIISARDTASSAVGRSWLDLKTQEPEKLSPLLKQYPAEEMEFYPVLRDVNSPAVDKASNIEAITEGA